MDYFLWVAYGNPLPRGNSRGFYKLDKDMKLKRKDSHTSKPYIRQEFRECPIAYSPFYRRYRRNHGIRKALIASLDIPEREVKKTVCSLEPVTRLNWDGELWYDWQWTDIEEITLIQSAPVERLWRQIKKSDVPNEWDDKGLGRRAKIGK